MGGAVRGTTALLGAALLLAGCTSSGGDRRSAGTTSPPPTTQPPSTSSTSPSSSGPGVRDTATLTCADSVDGDAPPKDDTVVLGAVALPASPRAAALPVSPTNDGSLPRLYAKTGLVVRTGVVAEIDVADSVDPHAGIGWANGPAVPSRRFVVPACRDDRGTGWLAFPGGYWSDVPVCLQLDVRVGDAVQRVEIGVGLACPGQATPPTS